MVLSVVFLIQQGKLPGSPGSIKIPGKVSLATWTNNVALSTRLYIVIVAFFCLEIERIYINELLTSDEIMVG